MSAKALQSRALVINKASVWQWKGCTVILWILSYRQSNHSWKTWLSRFRLNVFVKEKQRRQTRQLRLHIQKQWLRVSSKRAQWHAVATAVVAVTLTGVNRFGGTPLLNSPSFHRKKRSIYDPGMITPARALLNRSFWKHCVNRSMLRSHCVKSNGSNLDMRKHTVSCLTSNRILSRCVGSWAGMGFWARLKEGMARKSVCFSLKGGSESVDSNLVDSASSHTLVSKIKPCMCQYK